MSELFEKSMATLELPQVLALLADCAATLEGKERCLALRPMTDPDDVQRALDETTAAVNMLIQRGSPGFSGVKPVSASLQRADMGGSLSTRELLDIASVLRCARGARDYGDSEEKTVISHLFRSLTPNRFLEDSITNSILGEEEIADSASSELASIRLFTGSTETFMRSGAMSSRLCQMFMIDVLYTSVCSRTYKEIRPHLEKTRKAALRMHTFRGETVKG